METRYASDHERSTTSSGHRPAASAILKIRNDKPEKWYVLIYDLNEKSGRYKELEAKLKTMDAVEVLESTYFFKSRFQTAKEVWSIFRKYIDTSKERAIVMEIADNIFDSESDK